MTTPLKVAQIGFGGIGLTVAEMLANDEDFRYVAAVARPNRADSIYDILGHIPLVDNPNDIIAAKPDLLIECASHEALRDYAAPVLNAGIDLIAVSVGILADQNERLMIIAAAEKGGSSLQIPAGAIGGLDVVSAAKQAGLEEITYITRNVSDLFKSCLFCRTNHI